MERKNLSIMASWAIPLRVRRLKYIRSSVYFKSSIAVRENLPLDHPVVARNTCDFGTGFLQRRSSATPTSACCPADTVEECGA